jgi:hypothetical protein
MEPFCSQQNHKKKTSGMIMTENLELKACKAIYNAKIAANDVGSTLNRKVR